MAPGSGEIGKIARATHNIWAYRLLDRATGVRQQDNGDDGEKAAGAKLAALLELSKSENVVVVVSRWYGGVHLGPARFKYIVNVARELLERSKMSGRQRSRKGLDPGGGDDDESGSGGTNKKRKGGGGKRR